MTEAMKEISRRIAENQELLGRAARLEEGLKETLSGYERLGREIHEYSCRKEAAK